MYVTSIDFYVNATYHAKSNSFAPTLGLSIANIEPVLKMVPPPDFSRVLGTSVWDHLTLGLDAGT